MKTLIADPDDGMSAYGLEAGSSLTLVDPEPAFDTGYLAGRCSECNDAFRVAWSRVRLLLDSLEEQGRSSGEIQPHHRS
jgi:hypothetical protein